MLAAQAIPLGPKYLYLTHEYLARGRNQACAIACAGLEWAATIPRTIEVDPNGCPNIGVHLNVSDVLRPLKSAVSVDAEE
jgi:hypothetical protein